MMIRFGAARTGSSKTNAPSALRLGYFNRLSVAVNVMPICDKQVTASYEWLTYHMVGSCRYQKKINYQ
jgi:hypothetical protein